MARMDICRSAGVQLENLQQEGYFAMLEAIKVYSEDTGYKFITYVSYPLRNTLNTLIGARTNKDRTLNHAVSFDTPLTGDDIELWKSVFKNTLTMLLLSIDKIFVHIKGNNKLLFESKQFEEVSFASLNYNIDEALKLVETIME